MNAIRDTFIILFALERTLRLVVGLGPLWSGRRSKSPIELRKPNTTTTRKHNGEVDLDQVLKILQTRNCGQRVVEETGVASMLICFWTTVSSYWIDERSFIYISRFCFSWARTPKHNACQQFHFRRPCNSKSNGRIDFPCIDFPKIHECALKEVPEVKQFCEKFDMQTLVACRVVWIRRTSSIGPTHLRALHSASCLTHSFHCFHLFPNAEHTNKGRFFSSGTCHISNQIQNGVRFLISMIANSAIPTSCSGYACAIHTTDLQRYSRYGTSGKKNNKLATSKAWLCQTCWNS